MRRMCSALHKPVLGDGVQEAIASSSARNAAQSACAYLQAHMVTSSSALATTTGRPSEEAPNVPDHI